MEKELCPKCKSERTRLDESGVHQGYWVCCNQGCDGKLGADPYYWKPGMGLPPKPAKVAKAVTSKDST